MQPPRPGRGGRVLSGCPQPDCQRLPARTLVLNMPLSLPAPVRRTWRPRLDCQAARHRRLRLLPGRSKHRAEGCSARRRRGHVALAFRAGGRPRHQPGTAGGATAATSRESRLTNRFPAQTACGCLRCTEHAAPSRLQPRCSGLLHRAHFASYDASDGYCLARLCRHTRRLAMDHERRPDIGSSRSRRPGPTAARTPRWRRWRSRGPRLRSCRDGAEQARRF